MPRTAGLWRTILHRARADLPVVVAAGTLLTNMPTQADMEQAITDEGLQQDRNWIEKLYGIDIHNGALVAMDARTGDILAYVGSAGYYRGDLASPKFDPQFDVAGYGYRQPGSAWKPILYSAGSDAGKITPGTQFKVGHNDRRRRPPHGEENSGGSPPPPPPASTQPSGFSSCPSSRSPARR